MEFTERAYKIGMSETSPTEELNPRSAKREMLPMNSFPSDHEVHYRHRRFNYQKYLWLSTWHAVTTFYDRISVSCDLTLSAIFVSRTSVTYSSCRLGNLSEYNFNTGDSVHLGILNLIYILPFAITRCGLVDLSRST